GDHGDALHVHYGQLHLVHRGDRLVEVCRRGEVGLTEGFGPDVTALSHPFGFELASQAVGEPAVLEDAAPSRAYEGWVQHQERAAECCNGECGGSEERMAILCYCVPLIEDSVRRRSREDRAHCEGQHPEGTH